MSGKSAVNMIDVNDHLMTVKDLATIMHLSEAAIRQRIFRKQIPARKLGKYWYILNSELMGSLRERPSSMDRE